MGGIVVAYIILYFTKPSGLYGQTTAGDCWVSSRLGGTMTKNKSGEQGERSKEQRAEGREQGEREIWLCVRNRG